MHYYKRKNTKKKHNDKNFRIEYYVLTNAKLKF